MSYNDHFLSVRPYNRPLILSNDSSSKAIQAICPKFGKNVIWVCVCVCVCVCVWGGGGGVKIAKIMVIWFLVWLPWQQKAPIDL